MENSLRLKRDKKGDLIAAEGISPTLGIPVKIKPLTYGDSRSYDSFGKAMYNWSTEEKARLLREHLLIPEGFAHVTEDELFEDFDAWTVEDLVHSVAVYSGLSRLFQDGEEEDSEQGKEEGDELE